MNRITLAILGVVIVLVAVRIGIEVVSQPSDQEQIKEALKESIQASRDGKPGGVMELLGSQLTVNSQDASNANSEISDFIKKQHPEVKFEVLEPVVTGDHAQIVSPATVELNFLTVHRTLHLDNVVLIFQKEAATKWFVIPTKKWKLEQVQAPALTPDQLTN